MKRPLCLAWGVLASNLALAQSTGPPDYPAKPVRMIIPFAAGGPMDVLGRGLSQKISPSWGQNLLLDNRPGANTILALEIGRAHV